MSSIEGVTTGLDLTQLLQQIARQSSAANDSSATSARGASDAPRGGFDARFQEAALAAGLDPDAVAGLQDEIDTAIAAATQSSDGATDNRQTVRDAIDGVLQKHGVDLDQFHELMKPPAGGPPPGGSRESDLEAKFAQAAEAAGLDTTSAATLSDEIKSAVDQVLANADDQTDVQTAIQNAIDELLQKHGVDPSKFKQQLQALTGSTQSTVPLVDEQA